MRWWKTCAHVVTVHEPAYTIAHCTLSAVQWPRIGPSAEKRAAVFVGTKRADIFPVFTITLVRFHSPSPADYEVWGTRDAPQTTSSWLVRVIIY